MPRSHEVYQEPKACRNFLLKSASRFHLDFFSLMAALAVGSLEGPHVGAEEDSQRLLKTDSPEKQNALMLRVRSSQAWCLALMGTLALVLGAGLTYKSGVLGPPRSDVSPGPMEPSEGSGLIWLAKHVGKELPANFEDTMVSRGPTGLAAPSASKRSLRDIVRAIRIYRSRRKEESQKLNTANCVNTVWDMANFMGWAGLSIDALAIKGLCPDKADDKSCGATSVSLAVNLLWVLANAVQIPLWCLPSDAPLENSAQVGCVGTMATFFASILQITSDGLAMRTACDLGPKLEDFIPAVADFKAKVHARILDLKSQPFELPSQPRHQQSRNGTALLPPERWQDLRARFLQDIALLGPDETRKNELGACAMMTMQIVNDFPFLGIDVWSATMDCKKAATVNKLNKDYGLFQGDMPESTVKACTSDSLGIIGSFVNLATDIAVLISVCPGPKSRPKKLGRPLKHHTFFPYWVQRGSYSGRLFSEGFH